MAGVGPETEDGLEIETRDEKIGSASVIYIQSGESWRKGEARGEACATATVRYIIVSKAMATIEGQNQDVLTKAITPAIPPHRHTVKVRCNACT